MKKIKLILDLDNDIVEIYIGKKKIEIHEINNELEVNKLVKFKYLLLKTNGNIEINS